jgi:hypothetical protein
MALPTNIAVWEVFGSLLLLSLSQFTLGVNPNGGVIVWYLRDSGNCGTSVITVNKNGIFHRPSHKAHINPRVK